MITSRRRTTLAALALAVITACAPSAAASAGRASPGPLVWGPCPPAPGGTVVDPAQTCATLEAPLDHRRPDGQTIDLALSRIPAADPAKRRGVLLLNPGGPGTEGLNLPSQFGQLAPVEVLDAYDRIGFDPRGVGRSTPVTCDLTAAEMLPNIPFPDADGSIEANVAFARSAAARCADRSGGLLPFITTAATARDMDLIRRALGEQRISYWGGSYGSYLGAVYATLFPEATDRVVLDSAVDPTRIWYEEFRTQSAGMAARFPDAAQYAVDNAAGFGATTDEVAEAYLALAERLDTAPVAIPGSTVTMTGNVLRFATFTLLYQDAALPYLVQAWRAAADLADGTATAEQAGLLRTVLDALSPAATTSPGVPADNPVAAAYAVACGDVRWPTDVAEYARNVAADRETHPLSAGFPANLWPCAFWATAPVEPPVEVTGVGPRNVLILQNDRDPATPVESAAGLREALGDRAVLLTVDAGGHGVYGTAGPGACADAVANTFLTTGELPVGDVDCPKP